MALYPEYRETRTSFGIDVLGSVVVEVESESGVVGIGVSTGGVPAAFLVERHLARFVEGERADRIELMWDRMWRASLFYGRKGLAVNAISAVDLALWDLLGRLRGEPGLSLHRRRRARRARVLRDRPAAGPAERARLRRREAASPPWAGRG